MAKSAPSVVLWFFADACANRVFADVHGHVPVMFAVLDDWGFGSFAKHPTGSVLLFVDEDRKFGEDLLHEFGKEGGGFEVKLDMNVVVQKHVISKLDAEGGFEGQEEVVD